MFRALTLSGFFAPLSASSMIFSTVNLPMLDGVIGSVFNGGTAGDQSGSCVASAGDINGDGLSDFAIAAPRASSGAGVVSVFFGSRADFNSAVDLSTPPNGNNGFTIVGQSTGDNLGFSIASGDINGDGVSDLVVGAPFATGNGGGSGKVYVIYGTRAGFNATFPLATLNGNNGFVIYGVSGNDYTGYSVATGHFNGDGFSDLLLGAPFAAPGGLSASGSAYLVYGGNQTFPTPLQLSTLNGIQGSRFNGGVANYQSGYSVAMGNFNGDGYDELVIGANTASLPSLVNVGVVSVVFGTNAGFPATVNLSSVFNGTNGFNLYGVLAYDQTGNSVAVGDINGDGLSEIVIGSANANPGGRFTAGITYVLYGTSTPFNATFSLASLAVNAKGFQINGANVGDGSGKSVAIAGDVDGDGLKDLMIGAPYATLNSLAAVGKTYILFGTGNSNATVDLSSPGSNCLILQGGAAGENSGTSVVGAGDVNGDGLSDVIIGANGAAPYNRLIAGNSYLVYGDSIQLTNDQLTIAEGASRILTPSNLNASVSRHPEYTQYNIAAIQRVRFEYTTQPGIAITTFNGQDVMTGRVNVSHDGSELSPSFSVTAAHTWTATAFAYPANITFINQLPIIVNNSLIVNQGQNVQFDNTMLAATDPDNPQNNPGIMFTISGNPHGVFSIFSFSQQQLWDGIVYFTQDGTINAPQYAVSISRGGVTIGPSSPNISFDTTPQLIVNHFGICQGQTETVTPNMLNTTHPGANSSGTLIFTIANLQYGSFQYTNAPGVGIFAFSQAQVNNGSVQFVHDGSPNPPSFMFTLSDNRITTPSNFAGIYFTYAPTLRSNILTLAQGQATVLNSNMLYATDSSGEDVVFTVSNVAQGAFTYVNTTQKITQFNQSQVSANEIAFQTNDSPIASSFDVSVGNLCSETKPIAGFVNFNSAPVITNNQLTIINGQPSILSTAELSATDRETPLPDLGFTVSAVQRGHFELTARPGIPITVFSQQSVFNGGVIFVPDSSTALPAYNVSVSDGVLSTEPQEAIVKLQNSTVINNAVSNTEAANTGAIVGSVVAVGAAALLLFGLKYYLQKKEANAQFQRVLTAITTSEVDRVFDAEKVRPIASKIFDSIKTTGFCGRRTEADTQAYMEAIEKIVIALERQRVNINFEEMDPGYKKAFLQQIAKETREKSIPKHKDFCGPCTPHFKAEVSPQEIEYAAGSIASAMLVWQNRQRPRDTGIELKTTADEVRPSLNWAQQIHDVRSSVEGLKKQVDMHETTLASLGWSGAKAS